jgi:hypothetical protein
MWQPIKTAPMGRQVLFGKVGEEGLVVGVIDSDLPDKIWTGDMFLSNDATHWMPLPAPPTVESAPLQNAGATPTDEPVEVDAHNSSSSSLLSPVEGEYRSGSNQVGETTICPACVVQDPRLRLCDVHRSPVEGRTNDDDPARSPSDGSASATGSPRKPPPEGSAR